MFDLGWGLGMPVYELVENMPVEELQLWQMWMAKEPRGDKRGDWQAGIVAKIVHGVGQSFSKSRRDVPLKKFVLEFTVVAPTVEQDLKTLNAMFPGLIPQEDQFLPRQES